MRGIAFDSAVVRLCQEGNTLGTTEDCELLEIRLETQLPGDPPFFVVKTNGWSFDETEGLSSVLEKAKSAVLGLVEIVNKKE